MLAETLEVQEFANGMMRTAKAGYHTDGSIPAMTTPTVVFTPAAVEYVVAGSTICLVC